MAEYSYFIIEFDGRTRELDLINPRIYFEQGRCRFKYDGPIPGFWHAHIRARHQLGRGFEVKWELDRKPRTPAGAGHEAGHRPPLFLAHH
ncbi:hypothetical protein GGQ99_004725 [Aminobacter niigataensis]|uniref:Uncharacterized protein n=1 Tax=Aminobacter niigataensis TaxID=83265 RepID=A0ABR6L8J3_9HYPH|nr:hypothetical protein [Aminobacter niigataensis]MBB4652941.1 hypothetical protein [Aminobacter niigataensis]